MDTEVVEKVWGAITLELDAKAEEGVPLTEVSLESVEEEHVVIKDVGEGDLYHIDYSFREDGSVELGEWIPAEAEAEEPIVKEYIVPIEKTEGEAKRISYGVVLEPDEEDLQGDIVDSDDIEKAAHGWMENSRRGGLMHKETVAGAKVVESFLAPADFEFETPGGVEKVKKGSWILGMKWPQSIWKRIVGGELTGYSVGGEGVRLDMEAADVAKAFSEAVAEQIQKCHVRRRGNKWVVIAGGKVRGEHSTEAEAEEQARAIKGRDPDLQPEGRRARNRS